MFQIHTPKKHCKRFISKLEICQKTKLLQNLIHFQPSHLKPLLLKGFLPIISQESSIWIIFGNLLINLTELTPNFYCKRTLKITPTICFTSKVFYWLYLFKKFFYQAKLIHVSVVPVVAISFLASQRMPYCCVYVS